MAPLPPSLDRLLAHRAWVERLARRLVGDPGLAADVAQETWVAAWKHPPDPERPARPWLARVVRNLAHNARRERDRRRRREEATVAARRAPEDPADVLVRAEAHRRLVDAVLACEEPFRTTLLWRYFEGLSAARIAARADVPVGTVRWRLHRGRAFVRRALERQDGGGRGARALLSPLLVGPALPTMAGGGTGALMGVGAMKGWKLVLGLALLITGVATIAFLGPDSRPDADGTRAVAPPDGATAAPPPELAGVRHGPDADALVPAPTGEAPPPARVRMRTVDAQGVPLSGCTVTARYEFVRASEPSDAYGRVEALVEPADYWRTAEGAVLRALTLLEVGGRDVVPAAEVALLTSGETTDLGDVVLQPAGSVVGRVTDGDGRPLAGAHVGLIWDPHGASLHRAPRDGRVEGSGPFRSGPLPTVTDRSARAEFAAGGEGVGFLTVAEVDADGAFRLDGVPTGFCALVAALPGRHRRTTGPLTVHRGQVTDAGDLPLAASEAWIRGRVRDRRGDAASARVWIAADRDGDGPSPPVHTDEDGAYVLPLGDHIPPLVVHARSDDPLHGDAVAREVRPGRFLDLLVDARPSMAFTVRSEDGAPIESATWMLTATGGAPRQIGSWRDVPTEAGVLYVPLPQHPFHIDVHASGFVPARSDLIDPDAPPTDLVLVLEDRPVLEGRVTRAGRPLAGARVRTLLPATEGTAHVSEGFDLGVHPASGFEAHTDADGNFRIPYVGRRVVVRVHASGHPITSVGPLVPASEGPVHVEVGRGGTVEGRVLTPDGQAVPGVIVGASRGDGVVLTVRTDDEGRYLLSPLQAGAWQVHVSPREFHPDRPIPYYGQQPREGGFPGDTSVLDGRSTTKDLVHDAPPSFRVEGRMLIDGDPPGPWGVRLAAEGAESAGYTSALAPDGSFHLEVPTEGPHTVRWTSPSGPGQGALVVHDRFVVGPDAPPLLLDLDGGTLVVAGPSGTAVRVTGLTAGDRRWETWVFPRTDLPVTVGVPAGAVTVRVPPAPGGPRDPTQWPIVYEGVCRPGRPVHVSVDAR